MQSKCLNSPVSVAVLFCFQWILFHFAFLCIGAPSFVFKKGEFAGKKMSVFIWHTEKELISIKCLLHAGLFMYVISCNLTLSHMKDPLQKACESYPTSQQGRVQPWWPDSQHRSFLFPTAHLGPHCASLGLWNAGNRVGWGGWSFSGHFKQ